MSHSGALWAGVSGAHSSGPAFVTCPSFLRPLLQTLGCFPPVLAGSDANLQAGREPRAFFGR